MAKALADTLTASVGRGAIVATSVRGVDGRHWHDDANRGPRLASVVCGWLEGFKGHARSR